MVSLHIFDEKFKHLIAIHVKSASAAYNIIWNAVNKTLKKIIKCLQNQHYSESLKMMFCKLTYVKFVFSSHYKKFHLWWNR